MAKSKRLALFHRVSGPRSFVWYLNKKDEDLVSYQDAMLIQNFVAKHKKLFIAGNAVYTSTKQFKEKLKRSLSAI